MDPDKPAQVAVEQYRRTINWRVVYSIEAMYWMESSLYGRVIEWVNIWSTNYYASMSVVVARSNLLLLLRLLPLLFSKPRRLLYGSSKALRQLWLHGGWWPRSIWRCSDPSFLGRLRPRSGWRLNNFSLRWFCERGRNSERKN